MTETKKMTIEKETLINETESKTADSWLERFNAFFTSVYGTILFSFIQFKYRNYNLAAKSLMVHLEKDIFPKLLEKRIRWIELAIKQDSDGSEIFTGKAGKTSFDFPGTQDLVQLMRNTGVEHFRLNTSLEFNQILEAIIMFVYVQDFLSSGGGAPGKPESSWDKRSMADHILSDKGLHRFCADIRYIPDDKTVEMDYTYCELLMSRVFRDLSLKNVRFGDHRVFFNSASKVAGGAFIFFSVLFFLESMGIHLLAPFWIVLTFIIPLSLWGLMITFGSIQYAKEHDEFLKNEFLHNENLLARFPETNPNPIIKIGKKGKITYANPATYSFLEGLPEDHAIKDILPENYIELAKNCKETTEAEKNVSDKYLKYMISSFPEDNSAIFAGSDITHLRNIESDLRRMNDNLETLVDKRTEELHLTQDATITCLAGLSEIRDPETGEHIERTRIYVRNLAEHLRSHPKFKHYLNDKIINDLYKAAPLHDIGKVGIPDAILLKPGKLTDEEFEIMKQHAEFGAKALEQAAKSLGFSSILNIGMDIARSHHEKWNGKGYPQGLTKDEIPIPARLMALGDVYDALISRRVYKEPFSHEKAVSIITKDRGEHFDPDIVDAFTAIEKTFMEIAKQYPDSQ